MNDNDDLQKIPEIITDNSTHYELLLIANILNNIGLLDEYEGVLSIDDFNDSYMRYLYTLLQEYHAIYGNEKVTSDHIATVAIGLLRERKLKPTGISVKRVPMNVKDVMLFGSPKPVDSEAFRRVKRNSMLRRLHQAGFNVREIIENNDFFDMTAEDVIHWIYEKLDPIANTAMLHPHEDFGAKMTERALRFFTKPEFGLQTPFSFINEHMHGLCPNDFSLIGGLSNTGKGRFLMNLLVWLVAKEGQTVCLLSNEMTSDDFFKAMVCTIVNNPELNDKNLKLPQSNIVQSCFRDENNEIIERLPDEDGLAFQARVAENSTEYQVYEQILQWWEDEFSGKLLFVNVADDYSTTRLKQEIRRAKMKGCNVIAYDTLKGYQSTEWGDLVQATTDLSELIKSDCDGLIGIATFQLTDDVATCRPEELSNLKIARARGIMHLADNILMFMPLRDELKSNYCIAYSTTEDDGSGFGLTAVPDDKAIAAFRIIKNRRGGGKEPIYAVQHNLDLNRWAYVGELVNTSVMKHDWGYATAR